MPRLSPDGHWLAYASNRSGDFHVYVRPFPDSGGRVQVSTVSGVEPMWAASGRELFYRSPDGIMSVSVTTGATFGMGERKLVQAGDYLSNASHQNFDVSPDGQDILLIRRAGEEAQTVVVQNWLRELRARTAGQK